MYLIDRSHVRLLLLAFFDCMNKTGSNEPPPKRDQRATPDATPTCFCRFIALHQLVPTANSSAKDNRS